jgi:CubicO group peptidase (beta-lactamase class C family)
MRKAAFLIAVLLLNFLLCQSQGKKELLLSGQIRKLNGSTQSTADIDRIVTTLMKEANVPGFCISILNDDRVVYTQAYGLRDKEKMAPMDTATILYGASFSKAVISYIAMQLSQEGILDLDKQVWAYLSKPLPLYPNFNDLTDDDRWKLITLRDCLRHTTGFPNWRWLNPKGNNALEIFFDPGARYAYSGEGIVLLQLAMEEATGKKLEQLASERVFGPMGMKNSSYVWHDQYESDLAFGYDSSGHFVKLKRRTAANGAGSLETTIADYSRFIEAVMQGKGLNDSMFRQMISPQIAIKTKHQFPSLNTDTLEYPYQSIHLSYGLGWGLFECPYGKAFFKEGHDDGWSHFNVNFPDKKISIILMSNSSLAESIFKELLERIIGDVYTPWDWENYQPFHPAPEAIVETAPTTPNTNLSEYSGIYAADSVQASISLDNGVLYIEMAKGGLTKTPMNMDRPDFFSLKMAAIQFQFLRSPDGKIEKMIIQGGNEQHEFRKVK